MGLIKREDGQIQLFQFGDVCIGKDIFSDKAILKVLKDNHILHFYKVGKYRGWTLVGGKYE